jgi:hypothetical protein
MAGTGMQRKVLAAAAVALTAAGAGAVYLASPPRPAVTQAPEAPAEPRKAGLYCQFYVFVESRPFVAFQFELADEPSTYRQLYVAKADGDTTDYNAELGRQPEWRLDAKGDPPRLEGRVTVPAATQTGVGEEDIAIELRGFDPSREGRAWSEASLKSVYYQNLPGKCRQAAS